MHSFVLGAVALSGCGNAAPAAPVETTAATLQPTPGPLPGRSRSPRI
jgi:hypothetical protein